MAWMYLVLAGFLEIGWPRGLKLGWTEEGIRMLWLVFAIACILCSGFFAYGAKKFPWAQPMRCGLSIGAVGTFVVGIVAFGDAASIMRMVSAGLIIAGVIGLQVLPDCKRTAFERNKAEASAV